MKTPTARDMIKLPGPYLFKVIVNPELLDEAALLALTEKTLERPLVKSTVTSRPSKKGNYHSYSLNLHIEIYEEIEALYKVYSSHEAVVWAL